MSKNSWSLEWMVVFLAVFFLIVGGSLFVVDHQRFSERVFSLEERIDVLEEEAEVGKYAMSAVSDLEIFRPSIDRNGERVSGTVDFEDISTGFIRIATPEHKSTVSKQPVVFEGEVSANTERIVVDAFVVDEDGESKTASYEIEDFEKGQRSFIYTSKPEWNNLVEGTNNYTFKAFPDDGSEEDVTVTIYFDPDLE